MSWLFYKIYWPGQHRTDQYADNLVTRFRVTISVYDNASLPSDVICFRTLRSVEKMPLVDPELLQKRAEYQVDQSSFLAQLRTAINSGMELLNIESSPTEVIGLLRQKCAVCENTFESTRPAKTCSPACRVKASRMAAKQNVTDSVTVGGTNG